MLSEAKSLSTPFERNTVKQISILTTDKSEDTNRTRMEYILLLAINIGSKDLAIISARLGNNIITEANQASVVIYRWGHNDRDFPFGSRKSGNKMSVDFERNADDKIGMNPSRTIRTPRPHNTRAIANNCEIFDLVRMTSYLAFRFLTWYGTIESESENLLRKIRGNKTFKMLSAEIILKLKKLGAKIL